jgi:DNA (cytosine-5)-methyltransferase 1
VKFGSLFSGIGGLDLGLERAGMECRFQVEIDPFCRRVLAKHWPAVKRFGDITEVEGAELEPVELIAGGFPCQDVSLAGTRVGIDAGKRSGLWREYIRLVRALRPRFVLVENVPGLLTGGIGRVLGDLAASGYNAEWDCIPACALGAPHVRYRVFIVAYNSSQRCGAGRTGRSDTGGARESKRSLQTTDVDVCQSPRRRNHEGDEAPSDIDSQGRQDGRGEQSGEAPEGGAECRAPRCSVLSSYADFIGLAERQHAERVRELAAATRATPPDPDGEPTVRAAIARGERHAWTAEPGVVRMVHGVPNRMDQIRALGNSVVPQVAEFIGRQLMEALR